jgi:hypothetical protein
MSFVPAWGSVAMIVSMFGGLLSMIWYLLTAFGLLKLGKGVSEETTPHSS